MPRAVPDPHLAQRLEPIALPEVGGGQVRLGDLWSNGPVVLVHLRHFG